ncbi:MAG: hypothetical protein ACI4D3_01300, partial [Lachnospiraceae bacterium]
QRCNKSFPHFAVLHQLFKAKIYSWQHNKIFIVSLNSRNCSEPTSKTLRVSSVWRIRQIDSGNNRLVNASIRCLLLPESAWL